MIGLLLKDLYTLRQYVRTLLLMLVIYMVISAGLDNPASFFEGFIIIMSMMITITSFSYDDLAKWNRYVLSMPVTRKEIVGAKYLLSIVLCLAGTIISFLISSIVMKFEPVDGFGLKDHLLMTMMLVSVAAFFIGILLPLTFRFGVEKSRFFMIAIFAAPSAILIALDKSGVRFPTEASLLLIAKLLPFLMIVLFSISYLVSVKIFTSKEI
jgi:hypothetical protein